MRLRKRLGDAILAGLLCCGGCAGPTATPHPPAVAACPPPPAPVVSTPPSPAPRINDPLLERLVAAMNQLPAKEGWLLRDLHALPGHEATVAVIDQKEPLADCNRSQPLLLLGR